LDNLRVLKWAQYYGMSVGWNLLTALPGENLLDYQAQADLIPLLRHLPPPKECGPIWLERFSPYFRESDDGSSRVYPRDAYQFIYGKSSADLRRISYFWDWDARGTLPDNRLTPFYAAVKDWQKAWGQSQHPFLTYRRGPTWVEILDGRSGASVQRTILRGIENDIFLFCDETYRSLTEVLSCLKGSNRKSARRILIDLCQRGFLHEDGECFITLALPDRDGQ
jgi:hypothetical protein